MNQSGSGFSLPMAPSQPNGADNGHDHHQHESGHNPQHRLHAEAVIQVGLCASIGLVGVLLYFGGKLEIILAPKFHIWLLCSSIVLLCLALFRLVVTWQAISRQEKPAASSGCSSHGHDHDHTHDHQHEEKTVNGHDHQHGEACQVQDCGHDHSHAYEPIKAAVLAIPVCLFLLNLPNGSFAAMQELDLNNLDISMNIADKGTENNVSFPQLERAAQREEARQLYEGKTVSLIGQFAGDSDKKFTLIRYKMNCCAADAVPLNAAIFVDAKSPVQLPHKELRGKWVKVKGQVQFIKVKDGSYITALVLKPANDKELLEEWIQETTPDSIYLVN